MLLFNSSSSSSIGAINWQVIPNLASALLSLSRFPNGDGMEEEPLYVNAKQYHRILKRRQARAKLEAEGKIPKLRQVHCRYTMTYIHIIRLHMYTNEHVCIISGLSAFISVWF